MYYVVLVDAYGTSTHVEEFETREKAVAYIASLPDDYYMVILRNDDLRMKPIHCE